MRTEWHAFRASLLARDNTAAALRQAAKEDAGDGSLQCRLGVALARESSDQAFEILKAATVSAPGHAEALDALGYEFERRGDVAGAGEAYREAALHSRRFQPWFALCGFYARTGQMGSFWQAASRAANVEQSDRKPLFRLAAQVAPTKTSRLLQPETDSSRAAYVAFAITAQEPEEWLPLATALPDDGQFASLHLHACEALLARRRGHDAVAVWNRIPGVENLNVEKGMSLTTIGFVSRGEEGFGWRVTAPRSVIAHTTPEFRFEFDGNQPENVTLLRTFAPVLPGHSYRLQAAPETESSPSRWSGLQWMVDAGGVTVGAAPANSYVAFHVPSDTDLVEIVLLLRQVPGLARPAGVVTFRSAVLELQK